MRGYRYYLHVTDKEMRYGEDTEPTKVTGTNMRLNQGLNPSSPASEPVFFTTTLPLEEYCLWDTSVALSVKNTVCKKLVQSYCLH